MSRPPDQHRYSVEEYFRIEQESPEKYEDRDGELVAVSGVSYVHSLIAVNIGAELGNALKGTTYYVCAGNLRVRVSENEFYAYPDVSVICGPPQLDTQDPTRGTVTNPKLIAEVLSPSTAKYDRSEKFTRYRKIPSLEAYLLVWHDRPHVETYFRQSDGKWLISGVARCGSVVTIGCLGINLRLDEVYSGVEFPISSEAEAGT